MCFHSWIVGITFVDAWIGGKPFEWKQWRKAAGSQSSTKAYVKLDGNSRGFAVLSYRFHKVGGHADFVAVRWFLIKFAFRKSCSWS